MHEWSKVCLFLLLWHASRLSNCIVKTCIDNAHFTPFTLIDYKLSFYGNMFKLDIRSDLNLVAAILSVNT